jgi:hypothetical protein
MNREPRRQGERVMSNGYDQRPEYGSDAPWPNVVWTIIGILCACGLVALPFIGWPA